MGIVCGVLLAGAQARLPSQKWRQEALDVEGAEGRELLEQGSQLLAAWGHLDALSNDKIQAPPRALEVSEIRSRPERQCFSNLLKVNQGTERLKSTALASLLSL